MNTRIPGWMGRVMGAAIVALGIVFTAAMGSSASAATAPQLSVALSACGAGSSAAFNAAGNPVLTVGTASAGTCGAPANATYNPAYAQVSIKGVAGAPVPVSEPTFSTDNYASGSPRIVIDLNNGKFMVGYPAASGLNGTDMAWAVGNTGTYTPYATVYAAVNANTTTIKDAYIVEDADQVPGTADTLTNIQFGGATVHPVYSGVVQVKNRATGKCLNEDRNTGLLSTYTCLPQTYASLRWQVVTFSDGSRYLESVQTGGFVKDSTVNHQLSLASSPSPMTFANGGIFRFPNQLVMGVNNQGNFVPVIGSPANSSLNNVRWDFGAVAGASS